MSSSHSSTDTPHRITITICGDGGCGKSSITLRLVRSQWTHEYDPTIEDSYSLTRKIDGQTYHLSLTDTAGQEEYRGMWASSNLRSDAFLLVYDITNIHSLAVLQEFNDLIDIETETRCDAWESSHSNNGKKAKRKPAPGLNSQLLSEINGPVKPIKIVAGNKCDLQESRQVPAQMGLEWARKRGCGFMETSARNTVNIEETFALIVRRVVEARRIAAGGSEMGDMRGRGSMASEMLMGSGTRRAMTAPLSPLPAGMREMGDATNEKGVVIEGRGRGGRRIKEFFRKLRCW